MKTIKVNVIVELEIPVDENDPVSKNFPKGSIIQEIFDGFTNFAVCQHLLEAMKWLCKSKEDEKSTEYRIYKHHNIWAKIIQTAKTSYHFVTPMPKSDMDDNYSNVTEEKL